MEKKYPWNILIQCGAKAGIWVGKFEITGSYTDTCINESCDVSEVTILPNQVSIRNKTVSSFFYMARSMQMNNRETYGFDKNKGDLHMMKNDEWGAVAYLSQSRCGKYGNSDYSKVNKEVYTNNNSSGITGTSAGGPNISSSDNHYEYDDMQELGHGKGQAGPGASTTGTIYGVYDMSGGAYEYVMGLLEYDEQGNVVHKGQLAVGSSGFKGLDGSGNSTGSVSMPDKKYYNAYKSVNPSSNSWINTTTACNDGVCFGHALSETGSWYNNNANFLSRSYPWVLRGGIHSSPSNAGIFSTHNYSGVSGLSYSCPLTLI